MKSYNKEKIIIKINIKHIIGILVIILLILALLYSKIINTKVMNYKFAQQTEKFVDNNEEPIFKIEKILLYSSASAIDNSYGEVLQDLDISQFTDISISINNKNRIEDLTDENTIKELYIDNIKLETNSDIGEKNINYKNPYILGKFKMLDNCENQRINFKIVNTNQENENINYDEANFYTDCSNPLTLGYINKNLVEGYCVSENKNSVLFDGTLLKNAEVEIDEINAKISFQIHIKNNQNKNFVCSVVIDDNLDNNKDEIYNGYVLKVQNTDDKKYNFIQYN